MTNNVSKYPVVIHPLKPGHYIRAKVTSSEYNVTEDQFYEIKSYRFRDDLQVFVVHYLNDDGADHKVSNIRVKFGQIFYAHTYTANEAIEMINGDFVKDFPSQAPINIEIGQSSDDDFCITGLTLKQIVELAILLGVDREETLDENVEKLYENWLKSEALSNTTLVKLFDDEFCNAYGVSVMHTSEVYLIKEKLLKTILDHFKI